MTYFPEVASFKDITTLGIFSVCGVWLQGLCEVRVEFVVSRILPHRAEQPSVLCCDVELALVAIISP